MFNKISPSSMPRILPIKIICGDCAGDEILPVVTNARSQMPDRTDAVQHAVVVVMKWHRTSFRCWQKPLNFKEERS